MEHLELSMELLRTNKVDALAHSHSATNMSKSISGASLSSSQATHRTQCSSGLSSVSARLGNLSSSPASPTGDADAVATAAGAGSGSAGGAAAPAAAATEAPPRAAAPVAGGGKTVLAGVAPSCYGKLRRRARFSQFSGWKEPVYFELRSTTLLAFTEKGSGSGGGSGGGAGHGHGHGSSLASLAQKIMHPRHSAQPGVEWSWHMDLCGAERVVEQPSQNSSKKDVFSFAVEFPARERKKPLVLAAPSAAERKRWMAAIDRARRCVRPEVRV